MRVVLLPQPEGDTIAWEEILGTREGRFVVGQHGQVLYLHPSNPKQWRAGQTEAQFKVAAHAWNARMQEGASAPSPEAGDDVLKRLQQDLERAGVLTGEEDSLWDVLFEQVKDELM